MYRYNTQPPRVTDAEAWATLALACALALVRAPVLVLLEKSESMMKEQVITQIQAMPLISLFFSRCISL
jgi:hypothetical protein